MIGFFEVCYYIVDNHFILFDAGEGSIQTLASMGLPYRYLDTVFLTHLHSDHIAGLGQAFNITWDSGPRNKPLDVYGPYGVEKVVDRITQAYQFDIH